MSAVKHLCKHSAVSLSATRTLREQLSAIGRRPRTLLEVLCGTGK
ncbi:MULTISPECIES: hypothetical protein [unclassified Moorena]|nr:MULTISPECIES: hypothetical protein [unclassified Moorena]